MVARLVFLFLLTLPELTGCSSSQTSRGNFSSWVGLVDVVLSSFTLYAPFLILDLLREPFRDLLR
jgi:hypothetical protein